MIKPSAFLLVVGEEFSPSKAEGILNLTLGPLKNEPGELGSRGKYKGKPTPFGSATIEYEWTVSDPVFQENFPDLLPSNLDLFTVPNFVDVLRDCGAINITLYVNVGYDTQCNMELSSQLLSALGKLGIVVAITCYQLDEDDLQAHS